MLRIWIISLLFVLAHFKCQTTPTIRITAQSAGQPMELRNGKLPPLTRLDMEDCQLYAAHHKTGVFYRAGVAVERNLSDQIQAPIQLREIRFDTFRGFVVIPVGGKGYFGSFNDTWICLR